jgi:uncharacterized protein (TIGR02118 family)
MNPPLQEIDMSRSVLGIAVAVLAFAAGCTKPAQPPAAAPPGVTWSLLVLYNQPKDTAAFEKYYAETHLPLFTAHAPEIAPTRAELVKFAPGADGKAPPFYRSAELRWDSKEARDRGVAAFQPVAADIPKFATGGFIILLGQKTN